MTDTDIAITESEVRNDGVAANALAMLGNRNTGLGQRGRDKYLEHAIELDFTPINRAELQALYRKSKICEKVVDLLPKAATANNWLEVTIGKGRKGIPAKAVQYSEDLKLRSVVREAGIMGRLDGDGFVLLGVDDGGKPWEPVNEGRIRRISWVYPVDRWRLLPDTISGRPGHPEYYSLYLPFTEALPDQQTNGKVHRSRVLRFPGKKLWGEMIAYNTGYNDSVLQTFFQSFVRYLIAIEYSTRMVQDYNVFTYKLQGLAQLILAGDEEKIFHRFQAILTSLSSLGGLAMDADKEDAQFISRNFSGLDALIDRLKDDTSAAAAMPPTQLWGSSQKTALSNSSEGDKYAWADCVADYRAEVFEEPIEDFFRLVFLAQNGPTGGRLPESWGISYKSALRLNLKEQTSLRKDQTTGVDVPSITAGILLKEEVRESAWSGSEYTIERQLQPDLYTKQQAAAEAQQQSEPDEGSEAEADNQEEKPESDDASVNSLSDVFDEVDRTDDLGVGDADNPFVSTGGTSRTDAAGDEIFSEWRADAGTPCGKGWTKAGNKCKTGVHPNHPAANPAHPDHAAFKAATSGGKSKQPSDAAQAKANAFVADIAKKTGKPAGEIEARLTDIAKKTFADRIKGGDSPAEAKAAARKAVDQEAAKLSSQGAAAKAGTAKASDAEKSAFPSQAEFAQGKFANFVTRSLHGDDLFKVQAGGKELFAKRVDAATRQAEITTSKVAQDLGLKENILPATELKKGNTTFLVTPLVKGQKTGGDPDDETGKESHFSNKVLSKEKAASLHTFDLITANEDRNAGNVMVVNGKPTMIDHELSFGRSYEGMATNKKYGTTAYGTDLSVFYKHAAANYGGEVPLDKAMIRQAVAKLAEHKKQLAQNKLDPEQHERRVRLLEAVANSKNPTVEEYLRRADPKGVKALKEQREILDSMFDF